MNPIYVNGGDRRSDIEYRLESNVSALPFHSTAQQPSYANYLRGYGELRHCVVGRLFIWILLL